MVLTEGRCEGGGRESIYRSPSVPEIDLVVAPVVAASTGLLALYEQPLVPPQFRHT